MTTTTTTIEEIDLVISKTDEGVFEIKTTTKGVRLEVVAKQAGIDQFVLSGRGAKKYKEQIEKTLIAAQTDSVSSNVTQKEKPLENTKKKKEDAPKSIINSTLVIKEDLLLGYDVTAGSLMCKLKIKRGNTNSDFGWNGYEVIGLSELPKEEAVILEKRIMDEIEERRSQNNQHPLNILHGKPSPKAGEIVRVIANMFLELTPNMGREINPLKDKYVGLEARVVATQHSFSTGATYKLEFLEPQVQQMYVKDNEFKFHDKELLVI